MDLLETLALQIKLTMDNFHKIFSSEFGKGAGKINLLENGYASCTDNGFRNWSIAQFNP